MNNPKIETGKGWPLDPKRTGMLLALVILVGGWTLVARSSMFPPSYVPTPVETMRAGWNDASDIWASLLETLQIAVIGYLLGNFLAIIVGVATGRYYQLRQWAGGLIDFLRALPAVAMIPFAILVLGPRLQVGVFAVTWGCFFLAVTNISDGTRHTPEALENAIKSFRGSERQVLRVVVFPSILPYVLASLRQNISVALIVGVVTDMVLGRAGLGVYIIKAQGVLRTDLMYAAILLLALLGYISYALLESVERRFFPWWARRSQ